MPLSNLNFDTMLRGLSEKWGLKNWHTRALLLFLFISVFHSFIANDKYIIGSDTDGIRVFLPVSSSNKGIKPPIPYSDNTLDIKNRNVGPFDSQNVSSIYYRHWLGTDKIGRDVLAGILYGSAIALKIGLMTTLLSLIIGIFFGFLSGYLGDHSIRIGLIPFLILALMIFIFGFYIYYGSSVWRWFLLFAPIAFMAFYFTKVDYYINKGIAIPLDIIIIKIIEVMRSIPGVFLLLVLLALFSTPSIWNVVIVISLTRWPVVTRHLRADILKIKNEDFVTSAKVSGLSHFKIFKDYILPLTISTVIIISAFGFASAILLESSLSFLGIGIPIDQVSWGSILRDARQNFSSWWLAVFPGLMIFLVILLFNSIADSVSNRVQNLDMKGQLHR